MRAYPRRTPAPPSAADIARGEALTRIHNEAERAAHAIPCRTVDNGRPWLSDDPAEQRAAAYACRACPIFVLCRTYVDAFPELGGVYGGLTPADRTGPRATRSSPHTPPVGTRRHKHAQRRHGRASAAQNGAADTPVEPGEGEFNSPAPTPPHGDAVGRRVPRPDLKRRPLEDA